MKTFSKRSTGNYLNFLLALMLIIFFSSCETEPVQENSINTADAKAKVKDKDEDSEEMDGEEFPTFHQGFNDSVWPWADNSTEGFWGWCGTIELQDRTSGDLKPSAGKGYATIMFGACNDYWVENFGAASAPATFDDSLWSSFWPDSGFIHELDIYLDPDDFSFEDGNAFVYANSLYYPALEYPFIYFAVSVDILNGQLMVGEYAVEKEGWYTFRQVYSSNEEGELVVNFELTDNGRVFYTTPIDSTLGGEETSSYMTSGLGSGYIWFANLAEGVELAIDEYRLRPGK